MTITTICTYPLLSEVGPENFAIHDTVILDFRKLLYAFLSLIF